jgi:hypothetical protein
MKKFIVSMTSCVALGTIALAVGCSKPPAPSESATPGTESPTNAHGHDHSHSGHAPGPHDGTLADWGGGKYHVEFTVDHEKQEATVYVLGDDEKTPAPIPAEDIQLSIQDPPMQVTLKAVPQEGDPEGTSSRFIGNHEGLGVVQEYAGTMTGVIDGTPYSGDFKEEPHGAHEH